MEIDENMHSSFPEGKEEGQDAVQQTPVPAIEQRDNVPGDEEILHEAQQPEQRRGEEELDCGGSAIEDRQADDLSDAPQSAPAAVQELEHTTVHAPGKYARWFQVLAVLLALCLVGSVLLLVQPWRYADGQGKAGLHVPAPILPLRVTHWCVASGAPVDPQAGHVTLDKVVALSSDNAWLLGSTSKGDSRKENSGRTVPLLEHWNGKAWSIVPTADTSALVRHLLQTIGGGQMSEQISLNDIAVLAEHDVWVVGSISVQKIRLAPVFGELPSAVMLQSVGQPLVEHWDGKTWQIVANPASIDVPSTVAGLPGSSSAMLSSISVVSAHNIWAVGTQPVVTVLSSLSQFPSVITLGGVDRPLVEHWDGAAWSVVRLPESFHADMSLQIQALSASNVWVSGMDIQLDLSGSIPIRPSNPQPGSPPVISVKEIPATFTSRIIHWDGRTWNKIPLPAGVSKDGQLLDVAAITEDDLWAIAETANPQKKQWGLDTLQRWDGRRWSVVAGALDMSAQGAHPDTLTVIGPGNVWITGSTSKNQPFMEHWDGQTWSFVAPTSPAYGSTVSLAVAGNRAWALVDAYKASDAQKATSSGFALTTSGEVLETSC